MYIFQHFLNDYIWSMPVLEDMSHAHCLLLSFYIIIEFVRCGVKFRGKNSNYLFGPAARFVNEKLCLEVRWPEGLYFVTGWSIRGHQFDSFIKDHMLSQEWYDKWKWKCDDIQYSADPCQSLKYVISNFLNHAAFIA